jgi:hypothetical protein
MPLASHWASQVGKCQLAGAQSMFAVRYFHKIASIAASYSMNKPLLLTALLIAHRLGHGGICLPVHSCITQHLLLQTHDTAALLLQPEGPQQPLSCDPTYTSAFNSCTLSNHNCLRAPMQNEQWVSYHHKATALQKGMHRAQSAWLKQQQMLRAHHTQPGSDCLAVQHALVTCWTYAALPPLLNGLSVRRA